MRLGPRRGEGALHPGRVRSSSSWLPELLWPGKAQNAGPTESVFLWNTKNLNLSGLGLGSPHNAGTAPWRAARSLSSIDRESTHTLPERGQTQWGRKTVSAPHTGQWHLSAAPLPPHSTTEQANLNKRPPLPACVKAEIRHWRDLQTEAK